MSNTIRLRTLLRLTIGLAFWLQAHHLVTALDFNVSDTSNSIVYQPPEQWHSSTDLCSNCLNPGSSVSFHEGIFPPAGADPDDGLTTSSSSPPPQSSGPTPTSSTKKPKESDPDSHGGKNEGSRRALNKRIVERMDPDDIPGGKVSLTFNFTGSAVYIFATQPPNTMNANQTSSHMNVSIFLDNTQVTRASGWQSFPATYVTGRAVFNQTGLTEGPHSLVVELGQNSTFIFERMMYTTEATEVPPSTPSPVTGDQNDTMVKKHNIATFAGAVGGSVGVLGLFSLGLALSIIRRRQLAAKRERRDHESLHTNASDDSPHMMGPAPFVPRYFPDTVIPADPPTYMVALATNHNNSTLLASLPPDAFGATQRSYADIPPNIPPPPLEDPLLPILPPPPPFVPSPPAFPTIAEEGAQPPSIAGAEPPAHSVISVGTEPSDLAPTPELVPLLQPQSQPAPSIHSITRPRSRAASIESPPDNDVNDTEPAELTPLSREDAS